MEDIEQKIRQKIEGTLNQSCGAVKREQIMVQLEALSIIHAIASMVSEIEEDKQALIDSLKEANKKLPARLNQMSFINDQDRDQKIIELYKQGLSKGQIATSVGMTRQGVYKALERLNVNSV